MLTVFNRKELVITFSPDQQAMIRDLLEANKIRYQYYVFHFAKYVCECRIYVHRKDYEKAQYLLASRLMH